MDSIDHKYEIKDAASIFETKYRKALKQINNLLSSNRQLKFQLENFKSKYEINPYSNSTCEHLARERDDLKLEVHKLEDGLRQAESAKGVLDNQLSICKGRLQTLKNQYEQEIIELREEFSRKESEYRTKIEMLGHSDGDSENAILNQYRAALQKYKSQQLAWQSQKKSLYDHILNLESELEHGKREFERLNDRANVQIHQIAQKIRKEAQEQILNYRTEIGNLNEALQQKIQQNQDLCKQARHNLGSTIHKQREEAHTVLQLKAQILELKNEIKRVTQTFGDSNSDIVEKLKIDIMESRHRSQALSLENQELKKVVQQLKSTIENQKTLYMKIGGIHSSSSNDGGSRYIMTEQINLIKAELREKEEIIGRLRHDNERLRNQLEGPEEPLLSEGTRPPSLSLNRSALLKKVRKFRTLIDHLHIDRESDQIQSHLQTLLTEIYQRIKSDPQMQDNLYSREREEENSHHPQKMKQAQLKTKLDQYDRLASRLEEELQRAIKLDGRLTAHQSRRDTNIVSQTEYSNNRVQDLMERLVIEQRNFKQQLETQQLQFDAKLIAYRNEIKDLKQQIKGLETTSQRGNQLSQTIVRLEQANTELSTKVSELQSSLLLAQSKSTVQNTVSTELVQMISKLSDKDSKIIDLEFRIQELNESIYKYNQTVERLDREIGEREEVIKMLRLTQQEGHRKYDELQLENRRLNRNIESLIEQNLDLKSLQSRIEVLKKQDERRQTAYDLFHSENAKEKSKVKLLEGHIEDLNSSLERAKRENESLKHAVIELEDRISENVSLISRLKEQVGVFQENQRRRVSDASVISSQYENKLRNEIELIEAKHAQVQSSLERKIQETSRKHEQDVWRLNEEIENINIEGRRISDRKIAETRYQYQSQIQEMQSRTNRTISQLSSQLSLARNEIERVSQFESLYQQERSQHLSILSQFKTLEEKVIDLEYNARRAKELQNSVFELNRKLQDLQYRYDSDISSLNFERQRYDRLKAERDLEVNELNANFSRERLLLTDQIRNLKTQIAQLESAKMDIHFGSGNARESELQFRINTISDENLRLKDEIKILNREIAEVREYQSKCFQLEKKISELNFSREDQTFRIQHLVKQNNRFRQALTEYDDKYLEAERLLRESQRTINSYEHDIYDLKVENQKLTELKSGVKKLTETALKIPQNTEMFAEIERLRKMVLTLEEDINTLRLKYAGSMNNQQRLKENLALFVIVFAEIEALRSQLSAKDQQIEELIKTRTTRAIIGQRETNLTSFAEEQKSIVQTGITKFQENLHNIKAIKEEITQISELSKKGEQQINTMSISQQVELERTVEVKHHQAMRINNSVETKTFETCQKKQQQQQSVVLKPYSDIANPSVSEVFRSSERRVSTLQPDVSTLRVHSTQSVSEKTEAMNWRIINQSGSAYFNYQPISSEIRTQTVETPVASSLIKFFYKNAGTAEKLTHRNNISNNGSLVDRLTNIVTHIPQQQHQHQQHYHHHSHQHLLIPTGAVAQSVRLLPEHNAAIDGVIMSPTIYKPLSGNPNRISGHGLVVRQVSASPSRIK